MLAEAVLGALGSGLHHAFGQILALVGLDLDTACATDGSQQKKDPKHDGIVVQSGVGGKSLPGGVDQWLQEGAGAAAKELVGGDGPGDGRREGVVGGDEEATGGVGE